MSTVDLEANPPGLPVEIGKIDKELGKLWETSDDTKTRASLINLVIHTTNASAVAENTELISRIAGHHACRAILIFANPSAKSSMARAWISAHCYQLGKGMRQICSEQITFQLDGEMAEAVPNVVFSHLDSDLPLCLWWQGDLPASTEENMWGWVDRLIFDSRAWSDPGGQFARVQAIAQTSRARTVLCDLNWTRLLSARFALANVFDHPVALEAITKISAIHVSHAPGARSSALLLLGWLASQFGWAADSSSTPAFSHAENGKIQTTIDESPGACLSRLSFQAGIITIEVRRDAKSEFFHASITSDGREIASQTIPAGRDGIRENLLMELSRGGVHPLFTKALGKIPSDWF